MPRHRHRRERQTTHKEKTLGIIGGMGPSATVDLMEKIIACTHAVEEEDHLHLLVDCNPKLPNRQTAILEGTESPLPALIAMAQGLERGGADFLILGANTPHYYFNEIAAAVHIPMLHIPEETVAFICKNYGSAQGVGILAANAPMRTGLFQAACHKAGLAPVMLPEAEQQALHQAIFRFKVDGDRQALRLAGEKSVGALRAAGAAAVILGCTELPIVLIGTGCGIPLIDPNEIIAARVVAYAKEG